MITPRVLRFIFQYPIWTRGQKRMRRESITPRPGQADLVARLKYGGNEDYRGGGRFSARVTVGFVAAGAVAKKLISTIGIAGVRAYRGNRRDTCKKSPVQRKK